MTEQQQLVRTPAVASVPESGETSPAPLAPDLRSADRRDKPSRTDTLTAQLSPLVGGPVGEHALIGRVRFWTPLRVLMAFALVFLAFGWAGKAACIQQTTDSAGQPTLDWSNGRQYVAMCYSDTVPLYGAEHLNELAFPYRKQWTDFDGDGHPHTRYMEYPVLSGLYQYAAAEVSYAWSRVRLTPKALPVVLYFDTAALGLALAWLVTVWASSQLSGRRVWDAALVALSPLVLVHIFTNFDALATAFAATGMLAWARRRPVLAGVLLGLGGAAKLYPLLLLGPIVLLCLRTDSRQRLPGLRDLVRHSDIGFAAACREYLAGARIRPLRAAGITVAAAAAAWLAVNLPIAVPFRAGWWEFFRLNTERHADPDSAYNVITSFTGWSGFDGPLHPEQTPTLLNAVSLLLFLVACAAIGCIGLTAPRRPRLAQLAFLVVAAFLITNKVWSPQYSLWLVPLAALALPHRRILLAWMTVDALVWFPRMYYYLGTDRKGVPEQWFTGTVALRDLAVLALCALIVREIYRPATDPVRRGGVDDPAGGILDRAADPLLPWLPPWLQPQPAPVRPARIPVAAVAIPTDHEH
ncbi:glycosyltransferase family 87 protein [Nocardia sp. alder85J]|uniref:glycosyltransferase family 87 protein n=1 Tax=Nocardia sp. alder85J TaxID=2862949 RepID=UPI001CD5E626|nr:glycosyltransferase 87 family protein [Nocardia sp. alder85J]MCX4096390.1 glycosyltransferase 87 family protein [Nocardia sp. alder85J]